MKYKVTFINENAKNLKLKATIGTPKQKAYADSLRQMVIDRFKGKVDEELIYHVLNSDWWHKASNVIENRREFYNNDGMYDEKWMEQFERVKGEVATKNIGKENKSVELFIPSWAIHWVNDKDWGGFAHILFETRIHSIKVPYRDIVAFPIARVECPKSFIVSNDERGVKITFKKRDGRSLSYFNLKISSDISDLKNGIEYAGRLNGDGAYYATDRKDRGGWGKLVEVIREINSAFEKSV
jgi:hypothetical protein